MNELVDASYRLFAKYKAPSPLDVCTLCCMDSASEKLLASLPVRAIPQDLLEDYNDGASSEKTPPEEIKHFLPRYMELASAFTFPTHSTELTFRRLAPFDATEWSLEERRFLTRFADDYFQYCLSVYPLPYGETIDSILIMLWLGRFEIEGVLKQWQANTTVASILHFNDLYCQGFKPYNQQELNNPFGTGEKPLAEKLRAWLDDEAVHRSFAGAIEGIVVSNSDAVDPTQLEDMNWLYELLVA